uniref:Tensin 1b n=1 Tax=Salarias fasciatus TaxID=181472 RepID=A0A672HXI1_SALFA
MATAVFQVSSSCVPATNYELAPSSDLPLKHVDTMGSTKSSKSMESRRRPSRSVSLLQALEESYELDLILHHREDYLRLLPQQRGGAELRRQTAGGGLHAALQTWTQLPALNPERETLRHRPAEPKGAWTSAGPTTTLRIWTRSAASARPMDHVAERRQSQRGGHTQQGQQGQNRGGGGGLHALQQHICQVSEMT